MTNREARHYLAGLRSDSDFEAFCIDYFPSTHQSFGAGMDRTQRINLLFAEHSPETVTEAILREQLAMQEQLLDAGHPDIAATLNELGRTLYKQRKYDEAKLLFRRALAIWEKLDGAEDSKNVAGLLNELANILCKEGNVEEAEQYYRRSLTVWEKSVGANHPAFAVSLYNLASLLRTPERVKEAEQFHRRALAIREKTLSATHPDVANSLTCLATLLYEQGRYEEAEPLCRRACSIYEQTLPASHPLIDRTQRFLVLLQSQSGDPD